MQMNQTIEEMNSDLGASSRVSSRKNSSESFIAKPVRRTKRRTSSIDSQQTTGSVVINPSPKPASVSGSGQPSRHRQHTHTTQHRHYGQTAQEGQTGREEPSTRSERSLRQGAEKSRDVGLKKRHETGRDMMKSDVEQFVASLSGEVHRLKGEYAKQALACEEVVKDKNRLVQRMDVIDKRDALERTELNKKLESRFDRNVISKTTAINDLISECHEEMEIMNTKHSSSFFEKVLSFVFTSLIEGLSYLGFLPLSILSFCKYIFMMLIQDSNE